MASALFFLDLKGKVCQNLSIDLENHHKDLRTDHRLRCRPSSRVITVETFPCPLSTNSPSSSAKPKRSLRQYRLVSHTKASTYVVGYTCHDCLCPQGHA